MHLEVYPSADSGRKPRVNILDIFVKTSTNVDTDTSVNAPQFDSLAENTSTSDEHQTMETIDHPKVYEEPNHAGQGKFIRLFAFVI